MRKALALGTTAAALAVTAVVAGPVEAAQCSVAELAAGTCTTVALTVVDGSLSIVTTPAAAGTSDPVTSSLGTSTTISLGATTVTDTRLSSSGWTAKATSTELASASGAPAIPTNAHSFFVSSVTTLPVNTTLAYPDASNGTTEAPVASGDNLVTATSTGPSLAVIYTPSMRVAVPAGQLGGVYTGTVIQSVS